MFKFRHIAFVLALVLICTPAFANPLPNLSQLQRGKTTYMQVVARYGEPSSMQQLSDGRVRAFYASTRAQKPADHHSGLFGSLMHRVTSTVKAGVSQAIYRRTSDLGAASGLVGGVANDVADSTVDKLAHATQRRAQPAEPESGVSCTLWFNAKGVYSHGSCMYSK